MYKLFKDKTKTFSCNVDIQGASVNESKARIIVETKDFNLMYDGKIKSNGKCEVQIGKLKMLDENTTGNIKLEIIAEGTLFTPWESKFKVDTEKKVKITEVVEDDEKEELNENVSVKVSVDESFDEEDLKLLSEEIDDIVKKEKVVRVDESKLEEHITMLSRVINQKKKSGVALNDKVLNQIFEKYEQLVSKTRKPLTESEMKHIKNKTKRKLIL